MSPPLEHDYIGLSELPAAAAVGGGGGAGTEDGALNLKETELRLGLPGSESPGRKEKMGLTLELLPAKGFVSGGKRGFSEAIDEGGAGKWAFAAGGQLVGQGSAAKDAAAKVAGQEKKGNDRAIAPAAKAQVVGWPPIRSYRKNTMATNPSKNKEDAEGKQGQGCLYVKVSMDGAPYLRKVDLKMYNNYKELSSALEKMFSGFSIDQCSSPGITGRDGLSESRLMDLLDGSEYVLTYEDKDGDWMLVGDVPWEMFTNSCRRLRIIKGSDAIGLAPRTTEKCKNQS